MHYPSDIELMRHNPVDSLQYVFHYTTYSSALGILLSHQMRLGSLINMNDPLEFQDHHGEGLVFHGNPSNEFLASKIQNFENAVTEKEKTVRLVSFSVDAPFFNQPNGCQENFFNNLSKGWARSRMWAQYADNHKGVCLIFEKDNLEKAFRSAFNSESCKVFCKKVNYTNDLTALKDTLSKSCESFLTLDKIEFLFQKCEDFRDEQEFRLLLINKALKDVKEVVSFPIKGSLCGAIMGARFPKENEATLKKAMECCDSEIRLFSIWWDYGEPKLYDFTRHKEIMKKILDGG